MKKVILYLMTISFCACGNSQLPTTSPDGYDLTKPVIYQMPEDLLEISGITFYQQDPAIIYAEQDEKGTLYRLRPGDKTAESVDFGKDGDYEDLAFVGDQVVMLRSDGAIFSFPFYPDLFTAKKKLAGQQVKKSKKLVPKGEYEGMYATPDGKKLYVICKQCAVDRGKPQLTGYIFAVETTPAGANGASATLELQPSGSFTIDTRQIAAKLNSVNNKSGKNKKADGQQFRPSALSWNEKAKQWFVLSSVNKMLVITDANWQVIAVHHLKSALFPQPEGINFDRQNNLYISNEGSNTKSGTILKFPFQP